MIYRVKDFSIVNEAEADIFLEFSWFFYDPTDVGNLISGSSAFSKPSFYIWKLLVQELLKPSLNDFDNYLANMWNECNCVVVWTFFGVSLFWDCNENWQFAVFWHCWVFLICWHIEFSTLIASSFRIWNSSAGIPSDLMMEFHQIWCFLQPTWLHTPGCLALGSWEEGELEKALGPHSSTPAWKIPWTEEPGGLQYMGSLRVRHN